MSRVIAFDHGTRRIGVAVADTETGQAFSRPAILGARGDVIGPVVALTRAERADQVVVGPVYSKPQDPLAAEDLFSPAELAADLQAVGKKAHAGQSVDEICTFLAAACRPGDVVLSMSNGAFGGLPRKLLAALQRL